LKSRRLFLVVNAFVLVLSLLTALRVLPGPETAGTALAFYALFLFPGYAISRLASRRPAGLLEDICRIFLAGLLFLTVILALGFVPGISYRGIALAAFAVARRRHSDLSFGPAIYPADRTKAGLVDGVGNSLASS